MLKSQRFPPGVTKILPKLPRPPARKGFSGLRPGKISVLVSPENRKKLAEKSKIAQNKGFGGPFFFFSANFFLFSGGPKPIFFLP